MQPAKIAQIAVCASLMFRNFKAAPRFATSGMSVIPIVVMRYAAGYG
jgi:hypothetical protein